MKQLMFSILLSLTLLNSQAMDAVLVSQDLLYNVRVDEANDAQVDELATLTLKDLSSQLNSDNKRKAFWLNIYNAFIQIKAKANPEMLSGDRDTFFGNEWITIAGKDLSFDDIEHGILRRSKIKWGLGYLNKWFVSDYEKALRVDKVDYRIHFALNCGAASCPAIAYYSAENIEEELTTATGSFMQQESTYNEASNEVSLSKILFWFKGDFGGNDGIRNLLKAQEIIPQEVKPKLSYREYDWTVALQNYVD